VRRIGIVVHPTRPIDSALAELRDWTGEHGIELVQLPAMNAKRTVAPLGDVRACDLVVALGGDGTVLTALRAAAPEHVPVLGVACGSLGALSAVGADEIRHALEMYDAGRWTRRSLPAIDVQVGGAVVAWALNDLVLVRRIGQIAVEVEVGGELYARMSGDGVIVATPLGSSAYSMAAGGPIVVTGTAALVVTPLVIHGGSAPPLVVRSDVEVVLRATPGYAGMDVEVDGRPEPIEATTFSVRLTDARATLVALGDPGVGVLPLRDRGLIADSPRLLARDQRTESVPPGLA
jgi:NAD+ kinase